MRLFNKKNKSKKYKKNFAKNTYEVIDLDLEDTACVLDSIESGVVGTSTVFQKASRMIIMVDKNTSDIDRCLDNIMSMGLMHWDYGDIDVVFIAGSLSDFYLLCAYYVAKCTDNTFISFVINALKAIQADAHVFSNEQMSIFANSVDIVSTDILPDHDSNRLDSIINELRINDIKKYTIACIIISIDSNVIKRKHVMSLCDFSFVGETHIVAYMSRYKYDMLYATNIINIGNDDEEYEYDDMIATEVID